VIVVLYGLEAPFLLREVEPGVYKPMGGVYVRDVLQGGFLKSERDEEVFWLT
jgi:hypothetical protein